MAEALGIDKDKPKEAVTVAVKMLKGEGVVCWQIVLKAGSVGTNARLFILSCGQAQGIL